LPELPEAETIKRELEQSVVGLKIVDVEVPVSSVVKIPTNDFVRRVRGTTITGIGRRAKIILIHLSSGDTLLFHLKVAGNLLYMPADVEKEKAQVIFVLNNGYELRFRDPRLFGYVKLISGDVFRSPELSRLGPEPLSDQFTLDTFREMLQRRPRSQIKGLLLDQSFIAGIGNIYADEILFYARVYPTRPAGSLKDEEIRRIYEGIRVILSRAIAERGTSIISYIDLYGKKGNYGNFLKVHYQAGKPCGNDCAGTVVKIKVAGRGTYVCPDCQK